MHKILAVDLGEIGWRPEGSGDPDGEYVVLPRLPDQGCFVHPSCFTCPLPECRLVDPQGYQRWLRHDKERKILEAVFQEGLTVAQAASRFGRSESGVYRILRECRKCPRCGRSRSRIAHTNRKKRATVILHECRECRHRWRIIEEAGWPGP